MEGKEVGSAICQRGTNTASLKIKEREQGGVV